MIIKKQGGGLEIVFKVVANKIFESEEEVKIMQKRNNTKLSYRVLSVLLVAIMLFINIVGILPPLTAKADTPKTFTVYFQKPSNWDSPNIYFFQDNNTEMITWPGVAMSKFRDEWYSYKFTDQSHIKAVFYGGGDKQYPDRFESLYIDKEIWIYSDGTTTHTSPYHSDFDINVMFQKPNGWGTPNAYFYDNLGEPYPWPGEQMTNLGDGWYEAQEFQSVNAKVLFNNSNNIGQQIPSQNVEGFDVSIYEPAWFYSDGTRASANPRTNAKGIKVYFQKPDNWGNPSIYYYQDNRSELSWPGVPMKNEGNGWFSYNIITKEKPLVMFSSGSKQYPAQDQEGLLVEADTWFYSDFTRASANPLGNDHPIRVHFKKPSDWNNAWLYFYQDERDDYAWPGVAMTYEGNGWYSYDITTKQLPQVIFNDNNGKQINGHMQPGFFVNTESWFMNGEWYTEDPEPPQKTITIHFEKPDNWNETWIWYNSDSTKSEWDTTALKHPPGEMFEYRDGWYKKDIRIHDDATALFLFNDGTWNKKVDAGGSDFAASRNVWIDKTGQLHLEDPVQYSEGKRFYGIPGGYAPTGNYSQSFTDLTISSVLGELSLDRVYNSLEAANDSAFGKGFHYSYDMRVIDTSSMAYVIMPDSAWLSFEKNGNAYTAKDGRGTLEKSNGGYTYTTLGKMQYDFNSTGYLVSIKDHNDNTVNITRNTRNQITSMTDTASMSVSFTYTGDVVTKMKDNVSNREVLYGYNASNCLATVTLPGGFKTLYEYTNNVMNKITASPSANQSDTSPQIKAVLNYDGGLIKTIMDEQGLKSTYSYINKSSREVTITDDKAITTLIYNIALDITETKTAPVENPTEYSDKTKATYNDYHEITESEDVSGNRTRYTYDLRGNLTRIDYPDETTEQYSYDADNNKTSFTNKKGVVTSYAYDTYGNLLTETVSLNSVNHVMHQYEYHPNSTYPIKGLLKKEIDALGDNDNYMEYTYSFPLKGSVAKIVETTKKVNGSAYSSVTEYDKVGQVIKERTPTGIATTNTFDIAGLLIKTQIKDNSMIQQTTDYEYDGLGQQIKTTVTYADGSEPIVTKGYYDEKGNLETEIATDGTEREYSYDNYGNVEMQIGKDSSGNPLVTATIEYDELDRIVEEIIEDNKIGDTETTETAYRFNQERKVNITTTTDEYGGVTVTETGFDGRLLKQTNPNGLVQSNTYTSQGLLEREEYRDESGSTLRWTEYEYDDWDRVTVQTSSFKSAGNEDFAKTLYTYDIVGNVLTKLTKVGENRYKKNSYVYDTWGNKTRETTYDNFFDESGNAIGTLKAIHHDTEYTWDGLILKEKGITHTYDNARQLTNKTDAMGQSETYTYDRAGRLIETIDRNGTSHTVEYDDLNRVAKETSGNITKTNIYNEDDGKLAEVTETNNGVSTTVSYDYDGMGNIVKEISGNIIKTFSETKTATRREVLCTIADTTMNNDLQVTKQVYDPYGQLEKVYDMQVSETVPRVKYAYNLFGQLLVAAYANGTTETNTYNAAGLNISTANQTDDLSDYKYAYYYNGSQKTKTGNDGTTTYIYDGRGQLAETDMSNGTVQKYTFDDNGNRLTMKEIPSNGTAVITAYTYDPNDRLITEMKENLTTTYSYDANGNQLTKTSSGSPISQTHEFDDLNRMTCYNDGTTNVSYTYYPDNMRKSKKVGNETTTHVWLDDEIAMDMTANNVVNYIHGLKLIVSDYGWYHYNAHGDVVQLSDDSGVVTRDYDYDQYGNIIHSTSGMDNNPYRYCGEYYDTETSFTYLRARYYDPKIGRFISEDPVSDGVNWYAYCGNDPVNKTDPSGLSGVVKNKLNSSHMKGRKIFLDPGHGGNSKDPKEKGKRLGATRKYKGKTYYEKKLNFKLAKKVRQKLKSYGAKVIMSRYTDEHVPLENRYNFANFSRSDIFISIHHNSSRWPASMWRNGSIVIYPNNHNISLSKDLAEWVNGGVVSRTGLNWNSVYKDKENFAVLRGTKMPAILTETGYMSSDKDISQIINSSDRIASGIASGVWIHFKRQISKYR